jgi:hypothetical protein
VRIRVNNFPVLVRHPLNNFLSSRERLNDSDFRFDFRLEIRFDRRRDRSVRLKVTRVNRRPMTLVVSFGFACVGVKVLQHERELKWLSLH